jgi:hypothetical protein
MLSGIVWRFYIASYWTIHIPKDWVFQSEYLGELDYPDGHGVFPKKRTLNGYKRNLYMKEWNSKRAIIKDLYKTFDITTGEITWASDFNFEIDPKTGKNLHYPNHPEAKGLFYVFPENCEKKDYAFFNYTLNAHTLKYDRTEKISDVLLYVYKHIGDIDFWIRYDSSGFTIETGLDQLS